MMGNYGSHAPSFRRERGVRKVFPGYDECAAAWAHQLQSEGSAGGGRMFFIAKTIFSYGYHYPLAHIIERHHLTAVLLNESRFSVTTSRHQWTVRRAITGVFSEASTYHVPTELIVSFRNDGMIVAATNLFSHDKAEAKELLAKAKRARSRGDEYRRSAVALLQRSNRFAAFAGLKPPFVMQGETADSALEFAFALLGDSAILAEHLVNTNS
jgi:hypothetical protein